VFAVITLENLGSRGLSPICSTIDQINMMSTKNNSGGGGFNEAIQRWDQGCKAQAKSAADWSVTFHPPVLLARRFMPQPTWHQPSRTGAGFIVTHRASGPKFRSPSLASWRMRARCLFSRTSATQQPSTTGITHVS
jgi:hypothetical protein